MPSERVQRQIDRLLDEAEQAMGVLNWEVVFQRSQAVLVLDALNEDAKSYLDASERAAGATPKTAPQVAIPAPPAPVAPLPTSFVSGRYEVKRFLGEGGKKKVYLAHDTTLDRDVAFALIKTEGLDDAGRTRIQREAQAMGRLGSHPHIVTVFDLGVEGDQPYMVTELMGGGDVEALVEKAENHSIPLEQAIKTAIETCRGLEYSHSHGIVHRDLKPGNVWLTSDGVAKIGDFGLAVATDRSRLTQEGMMVGTVSYMPPEQAMGGEVTPRSDLYSFGAMLYEMVTGRPPFLGDDSIAIIGQHINTPPVAPTWHNAQCPRSLEALILRLLAKDPLQRPESATDVLAALEAIDTSSVAEFAPGDEGPSLDSIAGGVFVGRQREMGELKASLENALSGRGRLVTLVGEPGIGKSRTAQELATYAGLRQSQVLWGRCYEGTGAPPYWPWVQAIRSYVRDREPQQVSSEMGAGAADIAEIVSDVKEVLPNLPPPPTLEPDAARFRLFDSVTAFLKSAGRRQPLVLILEDLHWADTPSLLFLEFVARELSNERLMVIGTYRDVEVNRRTPLGRTLGELTRERLYQRILLRGLTQDDVARFMELASGVVPTQGMVEAVYRQTEGNPLFVTEVVRLLVQEGQIEHRDAATQRDSGTWALRIPEGIREVIGRRLERLSERCNQTLTIASIIGREFELRQLADLVEDMSEDRLLEVLEEALAARVIEELPRSVGRYQFTHALIQNTLNEELSATRRARLHARIAQVLEQMYENSIEAHASELAYHFAEAAVVIGTEKLVRYSGMAGERALAAYAWEEASEHFERALAAKEGQMPSAEPGHIADGETAALLYGLGRAQLTMLQVEEGWSNLTRAFDYYAAVKDIRRVADIAEYPVSVTATGSIAPLLARALELVPPDSYEAGRLLAWHGRLLNILQGDYEGAKDALSRALAIARREGDVALEMQALAFGADVEGIQLHYEQSLEKALQAIELIPHADNPLAEMFAHMYAALVLASTGSANDVVEQHGAAALAAAERMHDRVWLPLQLGGAGGRHARLGDWQVAREFTDRGLALAPRNPLILIPRILLEYEVGDFEGGEAYLKRLLEVASLTPPGPTVPSATIVGVIPLVARITGTTDRFDIAEAAAEAILSSPTSNPSFTQAARVGLALMAVQRADVAAAAEEYSALESRRGTFIPRLGFCYDHLLGLLAHTIGNLDQAMTHFEDALALCRKAGSRPELAWSCCDYADALFQRDGRGDRPKAMALLDESLLISRDLGMRPLMERVLARRDILKA